MWRKMIAFNWREQMFGSHKRQGREAGLATRNTFSAVSMGSSLFSFDKGFQPTLEFLRHPMS